jgi:hypothetical protein
MGSGDSDVPAGSGITDVTDCARATLEAAMVTRAVVFIAVTECETTLRRGCLVFALALALAFESASRGNALPTSDSYIPILNSILKTTSKVYHSWKYLEPGEGDPQIV